MIDLLRMGVAAMGVLALGAAAEAIPPVVLKPKPAPTTAATAAPATAPGSAATSDDGLPPGAIEAAWRHEMNYRARLARLNRLRELAQERGDTERVAKVDALYDKLEAAHAERVEEVRSQLSDAQRQRLEQRLAEGREYRDWAKPRREKALRQWADKRAQRREHRAEVRENVAEKRSAKVEAMQDKQAAVRDRQAQQREAVKDHQAAVGNRQAAHREAVKDHVAAVRGSGNAPGGSTEVIRDERTGRMRDAAQKDFGTTAAQPGGPGAKGKVPASGSGQKLRMKFTTQREADDEARKAIGRHNADGEFEKLRGEIEEAGM